MRERWGTFSVRDHMTKAPFVSDVLLYDRLVIPVPDPNEKSAEEQKFWKRFNPDELNNCLNILKIKTPLDDGLALTVPWDKSKRDRFSNKMSTASALATQQRNPDAGYYMDPFAMTRQLIKNEFLPAEPKDVSKVWALAAYGSAEEFNKAAEASDPDKRRDRLAALISHRFLTPAKNDPKHELLKKAVDLATSDTFRKKRAALYEWQEDIIEENVRDEKAINEMEKKLADYNTAIENSFDTVNEKFVFTLIPIGLGAAGALLSGAALPLVLVAAGGLVQLARFWRFDSKPKIDAGDADAAAMIHDARKALPLR